MSDTFKCPDCPRHYTEQIAPTALGVREQCCKAPVNAVTTNATELLPAWQIGYVTCASTRQVTLGRQVQSNILTSNLDAA